jgi:hypothetical protein
MSSSNSNSSSSSSTSTSTSGDAALHSSSSSPAHDTSLDPKMRRENRFICYAARDKWVMAWPARNGSCSFVLARAQFLTL